MSANVTNEESYTIKNEKECRRNEERKITLFIF